MSVQSCMLTGQSHDIVHVSTSIMIDHTNIIYSSCTSHQYALQVGNFPNSIKMVPQVLLENGNLKFNAMVASKLLYSQWLRI